MNLSQFCVLRALLTLAALTVPKARTSAEQNGCIRRDRAISIIDPNVLDADSDGGAIHLSYHYHDVFGICQVKYAISQP
jgi:hypothetical protein